jgi:hypothetical protein
MGLQMRQSKMEEFLLILIFAFSGSLIFANGVFATDQVVLLFFARNGSALTPQQVRSISNNGNKRHDNDFLVDPLTLRVIRAKPLRVSGANYVFDVYDKPAALAFNWPSEPQGYSLVLLDNGGKGFTNSATVNFTDHAARDVKLKLDAAIAARPDYQPSAKFRQAYDDAASHLAAADSNPDQAIKGKEGQLALDQLAIAYDDLLTEHGPVFARANRGSLTPWLGLTIDRTDNYPANLDLAVSLTQPYGWVRIVFDMGKKPSDYAALIRYAKDKGLKIMGEPVDSFFDRRYSRAQYKQRFIDCLDAFPQVDAWEVGNEVNGGWLSPEIPEKIADAVQEVRNRAPGKLTALTLFWQLNTQKAEYSMFTWVEKNLPNSVRQKLDAVLVSLYPEQAPMGLFFDQMMRTLRIEFPSQRIGIGELGYWIPKQQFWWAYDKADPMREGKRATAFRYYNATLDYTGSLGGGFWWTYLHDFPRDPSLQSIVRNVRDRLQSSRE